MPVLCGAMTVLGLVYTSVYIRQTRCYAIVSETIGKINRRREKYSKGQNTSNAVPREWHSKGRRFDPDILHFTTPCKTRGCVVSWLGHGDRRGLTVDRSVDRPDFRRRLLRPEPFRKPPKPRRPSARHSGRRRTRVVEMLSCRISSINLGGITRSAHRSPKARRKSSALANFVVSIGRRSPVAGSTLLLTLERTLTPARRPISQRWRKPHHPAAAGRSWGGERRTPCPAAARPEPGKAIGKTPGQGATAYPGFPFRPPRRSAAGAAGRTYRPPAPPRNHPTAGPRLRQAASRTTTSRQATAASISPRWGRQPSGWPSAASITLPR